MGFATHSILPQSRASLVRLLGSSLLAIGLPVVAQGQCRDGSPPPCAARTRPDTNVFVVLPFVVHGPASVQYLGESMVDLLHMALDGVAGIRVEYAPTTLRRLSELAAPQDARAATGVALELGAARVIGGSVVVDGSNVRIRAEIFDAVRGRTQYSVVGRADINAVNSAVDSLASEILARRLVPASERVHLSTGEYATKTPAALQAYLAARKHLLRGERRLAGDSLRSALRHDSLFALAHLLLIRLSSPFGLRGEEATLTTVLRGALEHKDRYPDRVRRMLEIENATHQGDRFRALSLADEAASRFPGDPDAAYQVADKYFHFGLNLGEPPERVIERFRRALALDDQDPELLDHFLVLMWETGDSTAARTALQQQCKSVTRDLCGNDWEFRAIHRREDPAVIVRGADSLAFGSQANFLVRLAAWNPPLALALTDSFASLQTAPSRERLLRFNAYIVRSAVALARGQYNASWEFLDTAAAFFSPPTLVSGYRMLHHVVSGSHPEAASVVLGRNQVYLLMTRAWLAATRQLPDSAERFLRDLESRAWPDSAMGLAVATGLRGLIALRAGDTTRARELLTRARANQMRRSIAHRITMPGAGLALTLAQIEAARGDMATARLYLADQYPMNFSMPFIGDAEELRAKVALALADTIAAKTALRNMIAVWEKADPPLQPRVAAARATLARLEGH